MHREPAARAPSVSMRVAIALLIAILAGSYAVEANAAVGAPGDPAVPGEGENLELVAEIAFQNGTHFEHATLKGKDYAFVSELTDTGGFLRVIDVTNPRKPRQVARIACGGYQGNIQISHDRRTLLIGIDSPSAGGCMPAEEMGFVTVDISNPKRPRPIGYAVIERGSHSLAAHPRKPYVYNGDGFPEAPGEMEVWSIKNPAKPKLVRTVDTGPHSPHDLSFNRKGDLAATANVVELQLFDTSDPANPQMVFRTQCPGCLHTHEARFTPDGKRLVVNDEYPIAPGCPSGLIYFYDVVRDAVSPSLAPIGAYTSDDLVLNPSGDPVTFCTPHIFDISADGKRIAASWHEAGVKYLDISQMSGVTAGSQQIAPGGVREVGWYANQGGDAFSAKLYKGPYLYLVDLNVGFQVFKISEG